MPSYLIDRSIGSYHTRTPILVYDAPIDEKTKKVREKFKVDEVTGYPEQYNWRAMARLGNKYTYEDPFLKFNPYNPEEDYSTKVTIGILSFVSCSIIHVGLALYQRRRWWSRPHYLAASTAGLAGGLLWYHEESLKRQGLKNAMILDYVRQHPERFGEIHRPKLREVLFYYVPNR